MKLFIYIRLKPFLTTDQILRMNKIEGSRSVGMIVKLIVMTKEWNLSFSNKNPLIQIDK